jgi:hypothetical protein
MNRRVFELGVLPFAGAPLSAQETVTRVEQRQGSFV